MGCMPIGLSHREVSCGLAAHGNPEVVQQGWRGTMESGYADGACHDGSTRVRGLSVGSTVLHQPLLVDTSC